MILYLPGHGSISIIYRFLPMSILYLDHLFLLPSFTWLNQSHPLLAAIYYLVGW